MKYQVTTRKGYQSARLAHLEQTLEDIKERLEELEGMESGTAAMRTAEYEFERLVRRFGMTANAARRAATETRSGT